jgi:hypothetical protein
MGRGAAQEIALPKRVPLSPTPPQEPSGAILQFKVWLLGLSPMVWRRVQVPASFTLRQFHGVIQVAMGWEGAHLFQFHLRAIRYGSLELSARSPETTLEDLRLRKRARFIYEYDLNVPWRHEIRLEERLEPVAKRNYPYCVDGHEACPPEDCGGPADYLARREAWHSMDAIDDLGVMAEVIDQAVIQGRQEILDDADTRWRLEGALERAEERERWRGRSFSRQAVNADLRRGQHLVLMHQRY